MSGVLNTAHVGYFFAYVCSEKKRQGVRGGTCAILCRRQWVEKKKNKTKQRNSVIPNFYRVNSRIQVTTLLVHKE